MNCGSLVQLGIALAVLVWYLQLRMSVHIASLKVKILLS